MLYTSGYFNSCITKTFNIFLTCFENLNFLFVNIPKNDNYKKNNFYNYNHLNKLEEVVIYNKQPKMLKKTKSDPNLKINFKTNNDIDKGWSIY